MIKTKDKVDMSLCVGNRILTEDNHYHMDNSTQIFMTNLPLFSKNETTCPHIYIWLEGIILCKVYKKGVITGIQSITCFLF